MFLMLDFETLGTRADTVCVSLGAVAFTKQGIVAKELFEIDIDDQFAQGRTVTGSTLKWWMRQESGARKVFHFNETPLKLGQFLDRFEFFIDDSLEKAKDTKRNLKPWGKGANFDVAIAEDMFRRHHVLKENGIPWHFSNVWCYRTFNNLTRCETLLKRPEGTHHNALEDALYQTNCIFAYWKYCAERDSK